MSLKITDYFVTIVIVVTVVAAAPSLGQQPMYSSLYNNIQDNNAITKLSNENPITYIKASIPMKIFRCMRNSAVLRCMKLFLLQRMDVNRVPTPGGNLTADFLDQIFTDDRKNEDIMQSRYARLNDTDLNDRLVQSFQRFFRGREIKLHFIPGMVVKVVPSDENTISFSLKRDQFVGGEEESRRRKQKHKHNYHYAMQLGLPALMLPAVALGSVLPMVLPALKMATIATTVINNGMLLAAIMYAAKSVADQQHEKSATSFNVAGGFH